MKNIYLILFSLLSCLYPAQTTLNAYARITSVTGNSVLALADVNITNHTFTVGGMVVIMQMQDDVIGTNTTNVNAFGNLSTIANAGRYEIRTIAAVSPTTGTPTSVTITPTLANTYNTGNNSRVQLISFRDLGANYTTTANISGIAWNGNVGGVVAFYVTNTLTLNHRVLADGLGFRGGSFSNSGNGPVCTSNSNTLYIANNNTLGFKGEGIYRNTNNNFNNARGKIINGGGGGNDHNAGGGGGGNYTNGGQGGNGYNNCTAFPGGGVGGVSLSAHISASRVFMGGGGGGGQQNNAQNSSGGNGGGIILIKANRIITSTTCGASIQISANGNTATGGGNDGMGGGGAGGSIVIDASTFSITTTCPLTVRSNGGSGGNSNDGAPHAGGGGGGQGVVIYSSAQPTVNVTTQANNGTPGQDSSGGTTSGTSGGGTNGSGVISAASGPLPVELLHFEGSLYDHRIQLNWSTASEKNNAYFTVQRSTDGTHFEDIAQVKGKGTTNTPSYYKIFDNEPANGVNYYRLKQSDFDGAYKYLPVIAVDFTERIDFSLFPNPVGSNEAIRLKLTKTKRINGIQISLLEFTGKEVYASYIPASNDTEVDFTTEPLQLQEGVYLLKIQSGSFTQTRKLVIK